MGKIFANINNMIMTSMKSGKRDESETYKLLKAKMLEFNTAKNAKPLTDNAEITIIQKMVKELSEDIKTYTAANRLELATEASTQHAVLNKLLPTVADSSDVEAWLVTKYGDVLEKSQMGTVIKDIKEQFIGFDGKIASEIVRNHIC